MFYVFWWFLNLSEPVWCSLMLIAFLGICLFFCTSLIFFAAVCIWYFVSAHVSPEANCRPTSRLRLSSLSCPRSQSQLGRRHVKRRQRGGSAASWHRKLQVKRERKQGEHAFSREPGVLPTRSPSSRRRNRKSSRIKRIRSTRKRWRRRKKWLWRKSRNQRRLSPQRPILAAPTREESWSSRKWQLSWLLTWRSFHPSLPLRLTALADSKFLQLLAWRGARSWRLPPYTLRLSSSWQGHEQNMAVPFSSTSMWSRSRWAEKSAPDGYDFFELCVRCQGQSRIPNLMPKLPKLMAQLIDVGWCWIP